MLRRHILLSAPALLLAGCASLPGHDPVQVRLVGIEPAEGAEALEIRFLCRLRVQNPNDRAITFSGAAVEISLRGNAIGAGVSDVAGTVPAFGDLLVGVPVSVSALGVVNTLLGLSMERETGPIDYLLRGKLGGGPFALRFESRGQITLNGGGARPGFGT